MRQISKFPLNNFYQLVNIIKKGCIVYLFFTFWCQELLSHFSVLQNWGSGVMILENKETLGIGDEAGGRYAEFLNLILN